MYLSCDTRSADDFSHDVKGRASSRPWLVTPASGMAKHRGDETVSCKYVQRVFKVLHAVQLDARRWQPRGTDSESDRGVI